jgi:hypothetical protein
MKEAAEAAPFPTKANHIKLMQTATYNIATDKAFVKQQKEENGNCRTLF